MALFEKPLFIFEMANNHQGDVEHGKKIINEMNKAAELYKDYFDFAFKFQYRDLDTFIHPDYKHRMDIKNIKRFTDTKLNEEQFLELKSEVEKVGMFTICTAFDEESVKKIKKHKYNVIKIASCSFTDWPLLEEIAKIKLPVIASTAGSSMEDIERVVLFFKHREIELSLMHCVAEYPTKPEALQMNQISLLKEKFPDIRIGFSTHESPDDTKPVRIAVAKGAEIYERHVGVPTEDIILNGYSSNPSQIKEWLDAAFKAYELCGQKERYIPSDKEKSDLLALQRGVFVKHDISAGTHIGKDDIYLAFPSASGQLLANQLSKYTSFKLKTYLEKDKPIMLSDVESENNADKIQNIVIEVLGLLKKSNVIIPMNCKCQISHHYGIDNFKKTGVAIIDIINREYCKKILILLPGQSHPAHFHKKKEETFTVMYGSLDVFSNGVEKNAKQGESMVIERNVNHSFASDTGCVFEEISTTHYADDSYYEEAEKFVNPRKTTVYITREKVEKINDNGNVI